MQESKESNGSAVLIAGAVLLVALLPLLYVLSIGPAVWLDDKGLINAKPGSLVQYVYMPVEYAAQHNATIEAMLRWYISFFRSLPVQ